MTDPAMPMPSRRLRSPYWHRDTHSLYVGDARAVLAEMPDRSADCIVTSPPYWGKRDYGMAGQYGHEPTPPAYVDTMRDVFREARRVLADDGTCWLNLGDSYSGQRRRRDRAARLPRPAPHHPPRGRAARQEPARPALAGRVRAPGRRLDPAERDRLAQAQRDARIGPRPAQLPARAAVPARQAARLLVRPRPDPRAAQTVTSASPDRAGRHPAAGPHRAATRPPKYGPGTPEVTDGPPLRRRPAPPRAPQRAQPRRRVVHPHPPLRAGRTSPPTRSTSRPVHRRRVQAGRHRARPVHRVRAPPAWPRSSSAALHRHRPVPGLRAAGRRPPRPGPAGRPGRPAMTARPRSGPRPVIVSRLVSSHVSRARLHVNARTRTLRQAVRRGRTVREPSGWSP